MCLLCSYFMCRHTEYTTHYREVQTLVSKLKENKHFSDVRLWSHGVYKCLPTNDENDKMPLHFFLASHIFLQSNQLINYCSNFSARRSPSAMHREAAPEAWINVSTRCCSNPSPASRDTSYCSKTCLSGWSVMWHLLNAFCSSTSFREICIKIRWYA